MSVKTKLDLLFVLYISGITNASICTNNQAIFFQWSAWSECTGSEHSRLCYADQSYETAICGSPTTTVTMTTARTTTLMTRSSFTTVPHFGKPEAAICTENQAIFFQWEAWGPCAGGTRSRHCYADDKYEHETCGGAITSVVTTASHVTYTNTDLSEIHSTSSPTDTRNCADLPCENGGHCTQLPVGHHCACPGDYTGDNCEKYLFPRFDNTCRTNSSCYAVFSEAIMWRDAQNSARRGLGTWPS
ncbi:hypothetical protein DPMN_015687 [Dreissena polymorpha]|uniref:EGF-like domain-containing protein n=1 Tax=Dreissena polymorpha TaxID=45954 RepID=A0A9D4S5T2_DREPO|nr:hypothetical protein DPMN_015687 [Dreissena polymorpha]